MSPSQSEARTAKGSCPSFLSIVGTVREVVLGGDQHNIGTAFLQSEGRSCQAGFQCLIIESIAPGTVSSKKFRRNARTSSGRTNVQVPTAPLHAPFPVRNFQHAAQRRNLAVRRLHTCTAPLTVTIYSALSNDHQRIPYRGTPTVQTGPKNCIVHPDAIPN